MKVAIIGTGYVDLTTGICLALLGHEVRCYDTDAQRLDKLIHGDAPLYEPGIELAMRSVLNRKRLSFTHRALEAVRDAGNQ